METSEIRHLVFLARNIVKYCFQKKELSHLPQPFRPMSGETAQVDKLYLHPGCLKPSHSLPPVFMTEQKQLFILLRVEAFPTLAQYQGFSV